MKRVFIFLFLLFAGIHANAQLVVDLTTGKDNSTGTQIPCGNSEDSWELNSTSGYVWPLVTDGLSATNSQQVWGVPYNSCGKWISATTLSNCKLPYMPQAAGAHEFKLTFYNNAGCGLTNVRFEISAIGVDNSIYFEFNNNTVQYPVSTQLSDCMFNVDNYSNVNTTGFVIPINPADIVPGMNELRAYVCNNDRNGGMYICGSLKADYLPDPNLVPSIGGATSFCSPSQISVTGSCPTTNVTWHYWEMVECDGSGNTTPGGYSWGGYFGGVPGPFQFPAGAPCGRYYRIKLALNNPCTFWAETTVIVRYNCSPTPAISGPSQVCYGQPATYCVTNPAPRTIYTWSNGASGTCATYTITASTTVSVTASQSTGCSGTASQAVTMLNTNPDFNLSTTFNSPYTYYTANATPVVTTGLPPGFGFAWFVEEVDASNNAIAGTNVCNPFAWWSSMSTNFCGYDGFNNSSYNCTGTVNCTTTPVGLFVNGHRYRITRGTWSTDCGWQQTSKIIYQCHNCRGTSSIIVVDDPNAPSYENQAQQLMGVHDATTQNNFTVIPNPNAGSFFLQLEQPVENGTGEIFNLLGEKVDGFTITATNTVTVNTMLPAGVYLVRITDGEKVMSQRMIVE